MRTVTGVDRPHPHRVGWQSRLVCDVTGYRVVILLYGPPGCGKGTQAAYISDRFGIPAISTGDMLRASFHDESQTSLRVKSGILVEDDLVNGMVSERLAGTDCGSGFLLDGYPRTVPQALFLEDLLALKRLPSPTVIHLDVPRDTLLARVSFRKQCPHCGRIYNQRFSAARNPGFCDDDGAELTRREDDDEQVIVSRLDSYERMALPVIAHYQAAHYYRLDGDRPPAEISRDIDHLIHPHSNGSL